MTGGINLASRAISADCYELNTRSRSVVKRPRMPEPRFCHASVVCREWLLVVGGVSSLMNDMGLRSVALGDRNCFAFDILRRNWVTLPQVPIGKLCPSLVQIGQRYVFQIGGFDDFHFDIYRLDVCNPGAGWRTYSLANKSIVQMPINEEFVAWK